MVDPPGDCFVETTQRFEFDIGQRYYASHRGGNICLVLYLKHILPKLFLLCHISYSH